MYYDGIPLRQAFADLDIQFDVDVKDSWNIDRDIDIPELIKEELTLRPYRDDFIHKYAWAIPSREAILKIISYSPIVEIGAGTGFWASLITNAGGDVIAYDLFPKRCACRHFGNDPPVILHYPVKYGGTPRAAQHPDRTLMLCWPPYESSMAHRALSYYRGNTLIYIGEWRGCTADERFHNKLEMEWTCIEEMAIPQWPGIHDNMTVWKR